MPSLTKCFVKGSGGIVVPVEFEFLPVTPTQGRPTCKWVNKKQWKEVTKMLKEAAEDAVKAETFSHPPLSRILSRPRTTLGYNLELNLRYLDLYNKDVRFWSDDEDNSDEGVLQTISKYYVTACIKLRTTSEEHDKRAIANYLQISEGIFADQLFCPLHTSASSRDSSRRKHGTSDFHSETVSKDARNEQAVVGHASRRPTFNDGPNLSPSGETVRSNEDDLNWNSMPKESYYEEQDDVPNNEEDSGGFYSFPHDSGDFLRDSCMPDDDEELPDIDYTPMIIPTSSPGRDASKSPRKRTTSGAGHSSRKRKEKKTKRKTVGFLSKVDLLRKDSHGNEKRPPTPPLNSVDAFPASNPKSTRRGSAKNSEKVGTKRRNSASGRAGKRKNSSENPSPSRSSLSKGKENLPSTLMSSLLLPDVTLNTNELRKEIDSDKSTPAHGSSANLCHIPSSVVSVPKSSTSSLQKKERGRKKKSKNNIRGSPDITKVLSGSKTRSSFKTKTVGSLTADKSMLNGMDNSPNSSVPPRGRGLRTAAERKVYSDSSQSFIMSNISNRTSISSELDFPDPEMPVLVPEILNIPEKLSTTRCPTPPVPILSPEGEGVVTFSNQKETVNAETTASTIPNTTLTATTPNHDLFSASTADTPSTSSSISLSSSTQSPVFSKNGKQSMSKKKVKRKNNLKRSFTNGTDKRSKNRRQTSDEILPPVRKIKKTITKSTNPSTPGSSVMVPSTNSVQNIISTPITTIASDENIVVPCQNGVAITVSIFPPPSSNVEGLDGNLNIHGHSLKQISQTSNQNNIVCLEIHTTPVQPSESFEDGSDVSLKFSSSAFLSIQQNYASDEESDPDVAMDFSTDSTQKNNDYASSSIPELDPGELDRLDLNLCDFDHVYNESELHLLDPGDTLGDPSNLAKYLNFDGSDDDQGFSNHRHSNEVEENSETQRGTICRRSSTEESSCNTSVDLPPPDANTLLNCPFLQMATFVRTDLKLQDPSAPQPTVPPVASSPTSFETIEETPGITSYDLPRSKRVNTKEISPDTVALNDKSPFGKNVKSGSGKSGKRGKKATKNLPASKKIKKSGTSGKVAKTTNDKLPTNEPVNKQKRKRSPMPIRVPQNDQISSRVANKKSKVPSEASRKGTSRKKDTDEVSESAYSASSSVCSGSSIQAAKVREHLQMYKKKLEYIDENHIRLCLKFLTEQNKTLHKAVRNITENGSRRAKVWEMKKHGNSEEIMKRLKSWDVLWPFSESLKEFMISELKIKLRDDYMIDGEDFIKYVAFPEAAIRVYALCCGCDTSFANCEKEMLIKSRRSVSTD